MFNLKIFLITYNLLKSAMDFRSFLSEKFTIWMLIN